MDAASTYRPETARRRSQQGVHQPVKRIPLRDRNKSVVAHALVDDSDYRWLNRWHWHRTADGYAARGESKPREVLVFMHREILGFKPSDGRRSDHRNRNRLDNRRSNLRPATPAQNNQNVGIRSNNTSGYRGVSRTRTGRWRASGTVDGKSYNLGHYDTPELAAKVASDWRAQHHPYA